MEATKKSFRKCWLLVVMLMAGTFYVQAQDLSGTWLTENGISKIQIHKEKDGLYYGKLIWTKDQSTKAKKFYGAMIMTGFKKESESMYKGKVHDPEKDKTYSCNLTMQNADALDLRGYIGISLIGRTEHWTRVFR